MGVVTGSGGDIVCLSMNISAGVDYIVWLLDLFYVFISFSKILLDYFGFLFGILVILFSLNLRRSGGIISAYCITL